MKVNVYHLIHFKTCAFDRNLLLHLDFFYTKKKSEFEHPKESVGTNLITINLSAITIFYIIKSVK